MEFLAVINELNDLTPEFHDQLVGAYLKDLKDRKDTESEGWNDLMNRLLVFLRTSKQYSLGRAFKSISRDGKKPGMF